jgi:hypothetical protein
MDTRLIFRDQFQSCDRKDGVGILDAWNLVSLPVVPPNPNAGAIFQNISGTPFAYFASIGWQQPAANILEYGRGYMVKYGSVIGTDASIAGVKSNEIRNVRIDEGWNTVGATSVPLTTDNIFLTPLAGNTRTPQLVSDVWEFIPTKGYQQTSFLLPTKGYFIKVDQVGYYNLNSQSTTGKKGDFAGKVATRETQVLQSQLSNVLISDARQNGQELYFGNATTNLTESRFEMPGAAADLDARFVSNHGNTSFNKSSYVIDIHAKSFPLTMSFSNLNSDVVVRDQNGALLGTASNNGKITITDANVHSIEISEKSTNGDNVNVSSFSLEQNTPNPFSGATTISFTIPQESPVSLVVYNELGQVVNTLVNQVVAAGPHTVAFDASNLANGTYYYTLKSGSFLKTQRMQIAK